MITLRALTFLAPNLRPVYEFALEWTGRALGISITLEEALDYTEAPRADLSFICGLPYVLAYGALEALAAPVLQGVRYQNRPIYFSDVIVRADRPWRTFEDLRGRSWAYNEPLSQSGCGIVCYALAQHGETASFFGRVMQAGFHEQAIALVAQGEADAAAIDTQVLAVKMRDHPALARQLRVTDTLGPSTIQPLAAARHLDFGLKRDIQAALVELHRDPVARPILDYGFIDRFVRLADADYDDIRAMRAECERAGVTRLD